MSHTYTRPQLGRYPQRKFVPLPEYYDWLDLTWLDWLRRNGLSMRTMNKLHPRNIVYRLWALCMTKRNRLQSVKSLHVSIRWDFLTLAYDVIAKEQSKASGFKQSSPKMIGYNRDKKQKFLDLVQKYNMSLSNSNLQDNKSGYTISVSNTSALKGLNLLFEENLLGFISELDLHFLGPIHEATPQLASAAHLFSLFPFGKVHISKVNIVIESIVPEETVYPLISLLHRTCCTSFTFSGGVPVRGVYETAKLDPVPFFGSDEIHPAVEHLRLQNPYTLFSSTLIQPWTGALIFGFPYLETIELDGISLNAGDLGQLLVTVMARFLKQLHISRCSLRLSDILDFLHRHPTIEKLKITDVSDYDLQEGLGSSPAATGNLLPKVVSISGPVRFIACLLELMEPKSSVNLTSLALGTESVDDTARPFVDSCGILLVLERAAVFSSISHLHFDVDRCTGSLAFLFISSPVTRERLTSICDISISCGPYSLRNRKQLLVSNHCITRQLLL